MAESKKMTIFAWLPTVITCIVLVATLGFKGGDADRSISGLRVDVADIKQSVAEQSGEVRQIREQLLRADGFREGMQSRLATLEAKCEEMARQHSLDDRATLEEFAHMRSLIENNKTAVRVVRSLFDQHAGNTQTKGGD